MTAPAVAPVPAPPRESELPRAYAAFAPILERLSEPMLKLLLGRLEQFEQLEADALIPPELTPHGEFEGLGGLTQRGELQHIVQSELLLRTEAPLEFLRRLAEAETLYLDRQYADPGVRTVYRAMISTGPGLLGHGRVLALAALLYLARLAERRGGDFHWCFLPREDGAVWFDTVSLNTVKRLLRSGGYREMTDHDVRDADALWTQLAPPTAGRKSPEIIDWVIGARPRRPATEAGTIFAVEAAANSLSFALTPPRAGQVRAAELRLRQAGRDRSQAIVDFPDDAVCVGALRNPFRPPAPSPPGSATSNLPAKTREPQGWAPRYFSLIGDNRIIRTPEGLLVLRLGRKQEVLGRWFAPIPDHMRLVGVHARAGDMSLVVHSRRDGRERLIRTVFHFDVTPGRSVRGPLAVAEAPTEHLFKRQPPFAIPSLTLGATRFHSPSGHPFTLTYESANSLRFKPLYDKPHIVCSTGTHEIFRHEKNGDVTLQVMRADGSHHFNVPAGPTHEGAIREVVYSHSERTVAWSRSPNAWVVAHPKLRASDSEPHAFILAPHERLLSARPQRDGAVVRVWSDARLGGSGSIRSLRLSDGEYPRVQNTLKLEEDGLSLVRVTLGDDGAIWGLTVDADGVPAELVNYRKRKDNGGAAAVRINIAEQVEAASQLDTGSFDA